MYVNWLAPSGQTIAVVFDPFPGFMTHLKNLAVDILTHCNCCNDAFWIYAAVADELVRLHDQAVWAIRNRVRAMETARNTETGVRPTPNYRRYHDIARHAIHVSETLDLATRTVRSIVEQRRDLVEIYEAIARQPKTGGENDQAGEDNPYPQAGLGVLSQEGQGQGQGTGNTGALHHIHRRLLFYYDVLESLRSRSQSNKERLLNEIQLSFHKTNI